MGFFRNLITFGAAGRVENKVDEFEDLRLEYEQLYSRMEKKRESVNGTLEKVIQVKLSAVKSLKQIHKISDNLKGKDREFLYHKVGDEVDNVDFARIEETISAADVAMNVTKGVSAGVGTALGAWALVSSLGTASTGAAIGTLTGAAATNATLAWFGGGALMASGGGMAAGTAVLGGILAIPALVLTGVFSHLKANKQIKEIESQMLKVIKGMEQINDNLLKLELIQKRSQELLVSIPKAQQVFEQELQKVYKQIYPIPYLSKFWKSLRKHLLRKTYFSQEDLNQIAYIGSIANQLATVIDTKVFD